MNLELVLRDIDLVPLGSEASFFFLMFFLVPADFSFLVKAAVERCFVDGFGCALVLPLAGVGGGTGSVVGFVVSICPPGIHLGDASPLGDDAGG